MDIFLLMDPDMFDADIYSADLLKALIDSDVIDHLKKDVRFLSPKKRGLYLNEGTWLDDILMKAGTSELILVNMHDTGSGIKTALNYILHNGPSGIGKKIIMF